MVREAEAHSVVEVIQENGELCVRLKNERSPTYQSVSPRDLDATDFQDLVNAFRRVYNGQLMYRNLVKSSVLAQYLDFPVVLGPDTLVTDIDEYLSLASKAGVVRYVRRTSARDGCKSWASLVCQDRASR